MRILVVKLADIGDVLTATPALRALRQSFPGATIAALVPPHSAAVLEGSPLVDEILPFPKARYDRPREALLPRNLAFALGFGLGLRRRPCDVLVLLHHLTTLWGTIKYAALALACGAPRRLGLDNGRGWFLTHRIRDGGFGTKHEVAYWLEVVGLLGATTNEHHLEITLTAQEEAFAARHLPRAGGGPWVALHPGTGSFSPARRWHLEGFAEVGRTLRRERRVRLVVVGGAEERPLAGELVERLRGDAPFDGLRTALNLAGRTSLKQLAAVLKRCRLFIGNDSGVMHLATAVGTPVVAVFGPSNDAAWGPWAPADDPQRARVVRVDLPCSPCFYRGYGLGRPQGCPERTCLQVVSPAMVVQEAMALLAAHGR